MPWVHLHVNQTGEVTPCCVTPWQNGFGNINKQSIEDVWNSDAIKAFRLKLQADQPDDRCWRCYAKEKAGLYSLRKATNEDYLHHFERVLNMQPDGSLENAPPVYFDIRYSNFCNFRCRICGPWSSNTWFNDARAMGMSENSLRLTHAIDNEDEFFEALKAYLPQAEEIYFAGGEPLLMEQHYRVLDMLIELNATHVYLRYNSNFSTFEFKGKSITDYWKQFPNIFLCASLDDNGARGELQRKEQRWSDVTEKRKLLLKECPHIDFMLAPTISVLNVFHISHFHRQWVEEGLIDVSEIFPSVLDQPEYYNIQMLPAAMKQQAADLLRAHVEWMRTQPSKDEPVKAVVMHEFLKCIDFMMADDLSHWQPKLREVTLRLDELRHEQTAVVIPELKPLLT